MDKKLSVRATDTDAELQKKRRVSKELSALIQRLLVFFRQSFVVIRIGRPQSSPFGAFFWRKALFAYSYCGLLGGERKKNLSR